MDTRPAMPPAGEGKSPRHGWLLYDADCGICSRWVPSWASALERHGLAVAPLQSPWVPERTGLGGADLLRDIRFLELNGSMHSGADAYRYLMRRIWWTYPLYLVSVMPGLGKVFDWGYRTFARHRNRISTTCGIA